MGEEITTSRFAERDFAEFAERLSEETGLLQVWFEEGRFAQEHAIGGLEVEAWIVDAQAQPAALNEPLLRRLASPYVVPELSRFNVELNVSPATLHADALRRLHADFERNWRRCNEAAAQIGAQLVMIGILPTVREEDLTLANMSDRERYRALNEQVFRMRHGRPIRLDIQGRERLQTDHHDVMLESATTSLQIHMQVDAAAAARYYNAAQIIAAPMVAVGANSPFLFGRDLWDETRITLFEQSINTCDESAPSGAWPRVTFGTGYVKESVFELFAENLTRFPVLLPVHFDEPAASLHHLRLHNGTIWRWNRPLIGVLPDGRAHLRIEHRVLPAGPSIVDSIANTALFFGLVHVLCTQHNAPEAELSFEQARVNLYETARHGLEAEIGWLGGVRVSVQTLLLEELLPLARQGLGALDIDAADAEAYLGVVEHRVASGRNGAAWQRAYRARHRCTMRELTLAYIERQREGRPVHEWTL